MTDTIVVEFTSVGDDGREFGFLDGVINSMLTQEQYRHRASFGKRQEYILIAKLLERGYDVYTPLVDDQQIDCIIRRDDHDYIDLQIKASSKNCKKTGAAFFAGIKIPNPREKYFFIFYCEWIDTYWIFPSIDLVVKARKDKNGTYDISLTGCSKKEGGVYALPKFSEYQDNFELLRT